jgi:hypothetical protein
MQSGEEQERGCDGYVNATASTPTALTNAADGVDHPCTSIPTSTTLSKPAPMCKNIWPTSTDEAHQHPVAIQPHPLTNPSGAAGTTLEPNNCTAPLETDHKELKENENEMEFKMSNEERGNGMRAETVCKNEQGRVQADEHVPIAILTTMPAVTTPSDNDSALGPAARQGNVLEKTPCSLSKPLLHLQTKPANGEMESRSTDA